MFLLVMTMEAKEMVMNWLLWHQSVKFFLQDIPLIEGAEIRFPKQYADILRVIGWEANGKEKEAHRELRRHDIRINGEKWDHGEYFLIWQHRGETELIRILEGKLRFEVQKKVNELMDAFALERANAEISLLQE